MGYESLDKLTPADEYKPDVQKLYLNEVTNEFHFTYSPACAIAEKATRARIVNKNLRIKFIF